jgi:ACS family tartrate transporter-like MFS transporter
MGGTLTTDLQTRTMRKVVTRLIPALLVLYIVAYLDRVNVTFAQDKLEADLGFSGAVYGLGAGIFFIGYFLLEVPSNLALHRFGARAAEHAPRERTGRFTRTETARDARLVT